MSSVALHVQSADWKFEPRILMWGVTMTAAVQAQMKVAAGAEELAQTETLIDLTKPDVDRRLPLEDAIHLVQERYSEAIRLLGKL
jgi:hypothetical protein